MKFPTAFLIVTILFAAVSSEDEVNLDEILKNDHLLNGYFECLVGKGKCSPDGQELKDKIPETLENGCEKCTKEEKEGIRKVIGFLIKEKPDLWKELEAKYDPEGKYQQKYAEKLAAASSS